MADLLVRVLDDDGEALEDVAVRLEFTKLTRGMSVADCTDNDGYAYFSGYDEGPIRIYINHKNYGEHYYSDGDIINITK